MLTVFIDNIKFLNNNKKFDVNINEQIIGSLEEEHTTTIQKEIDTQKKLNIIEFNSLIDKINQFRHNLSFPPIFDKTTDEDKNSLMNMTDFKEALNNFMPEAKNNISDTKTEKLSNELLSYLNNL